MPHLFAKFYEIHGKIVEALLLFHVWGWLGLLLSQRVAASVSQKGWLGPARDWLSQSCGLAGWACGPTRDGLPDLGLAVSNTTRLPHFVQPCLFC